MFDYEFYIDAVKKIQYEQGWSMAALYREMKLSYITYRKFTRKEVITLRVMKVIRDFVKTHEVKDGK